MPSQAALANFGRIAGRPAKPAMRANAVMPIIGEISTRRSGRDSWRLTQALQDQISRLAREGRLVELAPVLTFQSVVDFTVSTRAIITSLYAHLPANGSEPVLFDANRSAKLGPLLSTAADAVLTRILPSPSRPFRTVVITNAAGGQEVEECVVEAGADAEHERLLGLAYPLGVFSLSHVALPFPPSDGLYGSDPDPADDFGITLGTIAPARRARRSHRQPGYAPSYVVQLLLPVSDRPDRGRHQFGPGDGGGGRRAVTAKARDVDSSKTGTGCLRPSEDVRRMSAPLTRGRG
jgi:hypothetical protein